MATITIHINKSDVLAEVKMTSSYIGFKSQDAATYDKVALIGVNDEQLARFWSECRHTANSVLRRWVTADSSTGDAYIVTLSHSAAWNTAMQGTVAGLVKGYMVNAMLAKWLDVVGAQGAGDYSQVAATLLQDADRNMHIYNPPTRPQD